MIYIYLFDITAAIVGDVPNDQSHCGKSGRMDEEQGAVASGIVVLIEESQHQIPRGQTGCVDTVQGSS
jgi:hypothetical protein